jgi:hypothetical protein
MLFVMVSAKPAHFERRGVVIVVGDEVAIIPAAYFTGLGDKAAVRASPCNERCRA